MKYGPITPNTVPKDSCTNGAPFSSSDGTIPVQRHIIAVAVQMRIVSIKTESICTSPCLTGWLTLAAAAAFGAEPTPASLEYRPLLIPCIMAEPANPPKIALKSKALEKILTNTSGSLPMFKNMTATAIRM